jgi:DNA-binding response OmpR family regulator
MNILIVEDDRTLAFHIARIFESKITSNRIRTLHTVEGFDREIPYLWGYDIILMDMQISLLDGDLSWYEMIRIIREHQPYIPIIVISGRGELDILRHAFTLGANDYLVKPFRLAELEIRVYSWFRQYHFSSLKNNNGICKVHDLEYHLATNSFSVRGVQVQLTRMNKYLLSLFFSHSGKLLTSPFLREKIWWDRSDIVERNLRLVILRLKKSLKPYGLDIWIDTARGEWYILQPK